MADLTGTLGVFLILLAYFLLTTGRLDQQRKAYSMLNLVGAGLACISSVLLGSIPFMVLEGTWAAVSLWALLKRS